MANKPTSLFPAFTMLFFFCTYLPAEQITGSCVGESFQLESDGQMIRTTLPVTILRHRAPVFDDPKGATVIFHRNLGEMLEPVKISDSQNRGKIHVRVPGHQEPLGWMDRNDLLCSTTPLRHKGIERKLYILTEPTPEGEKPRTVTAYPSPDRQKCDNRCRALSRFNLYFVVAEGAKRLLLSEEYNLTVMPTLVGWVDKENGIPWNTRLGLRPQEGKETARIFLSPELPDGGTPSPQDLSEGIAVGGGNRWYTFEQRIPVIDIVNQNGAQYYQVAAPGVGVQRVIADDQRLRETEDLIADFRNVDIFFAMDGTNSMAPNIARVRQAAEKIAREFVDNYRSRNISFRFGFRVFRDTYAGRDGIGEGLPLSQDCSGSTNINGIENFSTELDRYHASLNDSGDPYPYYPEALFVGLRQAAADIATCQDNLKLLFVIGDAGDNQEKIPRSLPDLLDQSSDLLVPFFIQTKDRSANITKNLELYRLAYKRFRSQALNLAKELVPDRLDEIEIRAKDYLLKLEEDAVLIDRIMERVSYFSSSQQLDDLVVALRGGVPLKDYIMNSLESGDLPVLYWKLLHDHVCRALGPQCTNQVDHRVVQGYIPVSEDWAEELLISEKELMDWQSILLLFDRERLSHDPEVQRMVLTKNLVEALQNTLGTPPIGETGETFERYIVRKGGLPVREHGPLMQYELSEIRQVEVCELSRLVNWLRISYEAIRSVRMAPTTKVNLNYQRYDPTQCPAVSRKGATIHYAKIGLPQALGPTGEYTYAHEFRGDARYWLPKEFLP